MIVDYKILVAPKSEELSSRVNQAIADGWQPLGGVSVTSYGMYSGSFWISQAMVKYAQ